MITATRPMRYSRRSSLSTVVVVLTGLVAAGTAHAQKVASKPLTPEQKAAALETLNLVKELLKEDLKKKLTDLFNNPGEPNVEYDKVKGKDPTLNDGINKLAEMIGDDRVESAKLPKGRAYTDPAPGTNHDHIYIGEGFLERADDEGLGGVRGQLILAHVLLNEMVHVFQKFLGDDAKQCDAERDSHNASLKIQCIILDALTDDAGNNQSLAAVAAESPAMAAYLAKKGITRDSDVRYLVGELKPLKLARQKSLAKTFNANIIAGTSWGIAYYGVGNYQGPYNYAEKKRATFPHSIEIEALDESQTITYFVDSGWSLINAVIYQNDAEQVMLMAVLGDGAGMRALEFWTDIDTDGLPEPGSPSPLFPLTPVPPKAPEPDAAMIFNGFPPEFGAGGQEDGMLLLDTQFGRATLINLSSNGLPLGIPIDLYQHPILTNGNGFIYHAGYVEVAPDVFRFVFSNMPAVAQFGHVGGVWFDYDRIAQNVVGSSGGAPQTLAMSFSPVNDVGIERLEPAESNGVRLQGNPGAMVQMFAVSDGFMQPIVNGMVQPDGATPPLVANPPLAGSTLYAILSGAAAHLAFLPRLGESVAFAVLDETNDGAAERIQMSVDPARLHIMSGLTGLPPNSLALQYVFEQVLEFPNATAITKWEIGQPRIIFSSLQNIELTPIQGLEPPLYTAGLVDMDGDESADEAVVIYLEPDASPDFIAEVYATAGARGSAMVSSLTLPAGFEPDGYSFADLNLDGALDVATRDFFTGEILRLFNDGAGVLAIIAADGDVDDDGDVDLIDHAAFVDCHAGPNQDPQPVAGTTVAECLEAFDHDADADVDLADARAFQKAFGQAPLSARTASEEISVPAAQLPTDDAPESALPSSRSAAIRRPGR